MSLCFGILGPKVVSGLGTTVSAIIALITIGLAIYKNNIQTLINNIIFLNNLYIFNFLFFCIFQDNING